MSFVEIFNKTNMIKERKIFAAVRTNRNLQICFYNFFESNLKCKVYLGRELENGKIKIEFCNDGYFNIKKIKQYHRLIIRGLKINEKAPKERFLNDNGYDLRKFPIIEWVEDDQSLIISLPYTIAAALDI